MSNWKERLLPIESPPDYQSKVLPQLLAETARLKRRSIFSIWSFRLSLSAALAITLVFFVSTNRMEPHPKIHTAEKQDVPTHTEAPPLDMLRKMALLQMLPLYVDLDVLEAWNPTSYSLLGFFLASAEAGDDPLWEETPTFGEEPLREEHLAPPHDQLVREFRSLKRVIQVRIFKNYRVWKRLSLAEQKRTNDNYRKWQKMPPRGQARIRQKFRIWQNLDKSEKDRIRKIYRS